MSPMGRSRGRISSEARSAEDGPLTRRGSRMSIAGMNRIGCAGGDAARASAGRR
jgi:hypothetical protein